MLSGRPPQPLRILIASGDHLLTRRLLDELLHDDRLTVAGAADSAPEAAVLAQELSPDLVLVDQHTPPAGALAAIGAVAEVSSARAIVLIDEPPEVDWSSEDARRIVAFAAREAPVSELASVAYEVATLSLALEGLPR